MWLQAPRQREKSYRGNSKACIHTDERKKHIIRSGVLYIFYLSQMDRTNAWSFFTGLKVLYFSAWCNTFPGDGTSSIKSRKKPFSRMTNTHVFKQHGTRRLGGFGLHSDKRFSHKFFIPPLRSSSSFALNIHLLAHKSTCSEIPFCQLSAPDHVTIKDAALQLDTASKSQGKESWEKHLFLSSMRDHTGAGLDWGVVLRQIG